MNTTDPLRKAIEIAGSQSALARKIGKTQQHIWSWLNRDGRVPAEYCIAIQKATKRQVTAKELRPDIFGKPRKRD